MSVPGNLPISKGQQTSKILTIAALIMGLLVGIVLMMYSPAQEFMVVYQITVLFFAIATILGLYALSHARNNLTKQTHQNQTLIAQLSKHYEHAIENARIQADADALYQRTIEQLLAVLDAIEEGLILINQEGIIALANPRLSMLELSPLRLIGHPIVALLEKDAIGLCKPLGFDDADAVHALLAQLKNPSTWSEYAPHHYSLSITGQLRHFSRQILPVRDELGRVIGILLAYYDETQAQELDHAREQLTRMIVHDLRSPLTAVMTGFKIIHELIPPDAPRHDAIFSILETSKQALNKLLGRVDTLLDIAKLEDGKFGIEVAPHPLAPIIENVRTILAPMLSETHIQLIADLSDVPLLQIDHDKVERLILNLVDNALKYSPEHTTIHIKAKPHSQTMYRIEVSDEGVGIPVEARQSLFDSFTQLQGRKSVRRGVGLGLAFCKLVTTAHGGDIWIEDNTPRGSRFVVTLPIAHANIGDETEVATKPSKPITPSPV